MVADSVAINQFTMDSSQSLVVDSASVSEKLAPSASGEMLKFWSMREVVYNAMDLHREVFTVKIPFVV